MTSESEELGVVTARFEVVDRAELIEVRDALRAAGFDATVSPLMTLPEGPTLGEDRR